MSITDPVKLDRKELQRSVEEKHTSISYAKPKETTKMSKCWSKFSQIYVANVKQDIL
jgi:hypothetical protein